LNVPLLSMTFYIASINIDSGMGIEYLPELIQNVFFLVMVGDSLRMEFNL